MKNKHQIKLMLERIKRQNFVNEDFCRGYIHSFYVFTNNIDNIGDVEYLAQKYIYKDPAAVRPRPQRQG